MEYILYVAWYCVTFYRLIKILDIEEVFMALTDKHQ